MDNFTSRGTTHKPANAFLAVILSSFIIALATIPSTPSISLAGAARCGRVVKTTSMGTLKSSVAHYTHSGALPSWRLNQGFPAHAYTFTVSAKFIADVDCGQTTYIMRGRVGGEVCEDDLKSRAIEWFGGGDGISSSINSKRVTLSPGTYCIIVSADRGDWDPYDNLSRVMAGGSYTLRVHPHPSGSATGAGSRDTSTRSTRSTRTTKDRAGTARTPTTTRHRRTDRGTYTRRHEGQPRPAYVPPPGPVDNSPPIEVIPSGEIHRLMPDSILDAALMETEDRRQWGTFTRRYGTKEAKSSILIEIMKNPMAREQELTPEIYKQFVREHQADIDRAGAKIKMYDDYPVTIGKDSPGYWITGSFMFSWFACQIQCTGSYSYMKYFDAAVRSVLARLGYASSQPSMEELAEQAKGQPTQQAAETAAQPATPPPPPAATPPSLSIKMQPPQISQCESGNAPVEVTVSNSGETAAENVVINVVDNDKKMLSQTPVGQVPPKSEKKVSVNINVDFDALQIPRGRCKWCFIIGAVSSNAQESASNFSVCKVCPGIVTVKITPVEIIISPGKISQIQIDIENTNDLEVSGRLGCELAGTKYAAEHHRTIGLTVSGGKVRKIGKDAHWAWKSELAGLQLEIQNVIEQHVNENKALPPEGRLYFYFKEDKEPDKYREHGTYVNFRYGGKWKEEYTSAQTQAVREAAAKQAQEDKDPTMAALLKTKPEQVEFLQKLFMNGADIGEFKIVLYSDADPEFAKLGGSSSWDHINRRIKLYRGKGSSQDAIQAAGWNQPPDQDTLDRLRYDLVHEMAHVMTYDMVRRLGYTNNAGRPAKAPVWYVEGLAEFAAMRWDRQDAPIYLNDVIKALKERVRAGESAKLILDKAIDASERPGAAGWKIHDAEYGAAATFVEYLYKKHGGSKTIVSIWVDAAQNGDVAAACLRHTGQTFPALANGWQEYLKAEYPTD